VPLADFTEFKQKLCAPHQSWIYHSGGVTLSAAGAAWASSWLDRGGAAPATSRSLDKNTTGNMFLGQQYDNANPLYVVQSEIWQQRVTGLTSSTMQLIMDRLVDTTGLDLTVTTEQTTNLPTPALTRYTDGVGVMAALHLYLIGGGTAVTATLNYTNQAGTPGRTSKPFALVASQVQDSFCVFSLQDGDKGVRSVEGITLSGTTGSASSAGIVLFKPIMVLPRLSGDMSTPPIPEFLAGRMPPVSHDACVDMVTVWQGLSATNASMRLSVAEG